jgi:hypothetical protein
MDNHLVAEFDKTIAWIRDLRKEVLDHPTLTGQKDVEQTNPAARSMSEQESHLRRLAKLVGPKNFEEELTSEFRAAKRHIAKLRPFVEVEPVVPGQRNSYTENPLTAVLVIEQRHHDGVAALLKAAKAAVPAGDDELAELLGDNDASGD